uniref:Uncharacterized protein n=1 Tax=Arundo donax TaxID=35708 RepID=A0A0A9ABS7_ARUDO
MAATPPASPSR